MAVNCAPNPCSAKAPSIAAIKRCLLLVCRIHHRLAWVIMGVTLPPPIHKDKIASPIVWAVILAGARLNVWLLWNK